MATLNFYENKKKKQVILLKLLMLLLRVTAFDIQRRNTKKKIKKTRNILLIELMCNKF